MSAQEPEPAALGEVEQAIQEFFTARTSKKDSPNTRAAYARDLRQILREVTRVLDAALMRTYDDDAETSIADVTLADIRDLKVLRRAFAAYSEPRSHSTVRRCLSTWSEFFKFLVSEELVDGSPMPAIYRPPAIKRLPKSFDAEDERRIVTTVLGDGVPRRDPWPELDLAAVNTLLATATRLSELLGADIGDVTHTPGNERLRVTGKGSNERMVPLERADVGILERYLTSRRARFPESVRKHGVGEDAPIWAWFPRDAPLFVDRHGNRMERGGLQYLVQLVYRAAGVDSKRARGALVHALRHTTATRHAENGVTGIDLMVLLGHASLQTTQIYLSTTADALRAALAKTPTARLRMVSASTAESEPPVEQ